MSEQSWQKVWESRRLNPDEKSELKRLMTADGFEGLGGVGEGEWREYVARIGSRLGVTPGSSLYEVGCGAGAFLQPWREADVELGGLERSATLLDFARAALPNARLERAEAAALDCDFRYDVVVSNGVFLYFTSLPYAGEVLDRMTKKARRALAVLDVPDAAYKTEALAMRRGLLGAAAYDEKYRGLDHLYFERGWFEKTLSAIGLQRVEIEDQTLGGYAHAPFRYNVFAWW